MEEIDRLKLRAQVVAQAAGIVLVSGGEQTATKVVEAAEVLWAWIKKDND